MMPFVDAHTHQKTPPNETLISIQNLIVGRDALTPTDVPNCSVGIHPWYISEDPDNQFAQLREWAAHPSVRAIGECGLDRLRGPSMVVQQVVFERQITLSEAVQKPVVIHCVRAFAEVLALHKRLKPTQPWLLHGVNNRLALVKPLFDVGFYGSFGAALLRPNEPAQQALQSLNPDRILLETDDQAIDIQGIYGAAARQLGWSMERLTEQVWRNAQQVFGL